MTRAMQRWSVAVLCLSLALTAAACGKKAEAPAPEPATPAVVAFAVTGVDLGKAIGGDKRVAEKTETFAPKDTIYASVLTVGASPGVTLKARWTDQDAQVVDESEQPIAPTGEAATEFHIANPGGWPLGKYKVEIMADGATVQSKDFEVK